MALVDNLINTICIIVFDNVNGKLFQKLCCIFVQLSNNINNNNINPTNNAARERKKASNPSSKSRKASGSEIETNLSDLVNGASLDHEMLAEKRRQGKSQTGTASIALSATLETIQRYVVLYWGKLNVTPTI